MHTFLLSLATIAALTLLAAPVTAGGMAFDTPTLTWPQPCLTTNGQTPSTDTTCLPASE